MERGAGGGRRRRFPELPGFEPTGRRVRVPTDLDRRAVVVVGFSIDHQLVIDGWIDRALAEVPTAPVVEVPVVRRGRLRRQPSAPDGSSPRGGELAVLRRSIAVYTDLDGFTGSTGIDDRSTAWALVVEPGGEVRAAAAGPVTDDRWRLVAQALRD